jgi:hypothetical protein
MPRLAERALELAAIGETASLINVEHDTVRAVMLVRQDLADAMIALHASASIPGVVPILYFTGQGGISQETLLEIRRLQPRGVPSDSGIQIYLVGCVSHEVGRQLETFRYRVRDLIAEDPSAVANVVDQWRSTIAHGNDDEIVIASLDRPSSIQPIASAELENASQRGFAWILPDSIPPSTRAIIYRHAPNGGARIVLADDGRVSDRTVAELSTFGSVRRIDRGLALSDQVGTTNR